MVGPPLDHMNTEDLNACFHDIGTLILWERDPNKKGRVVAKVRVTDLVEIPKSIRFTEGNRPESESWTFSVEVLQHNLLGGGPPDEDPLPGDGVDPHPLPNVLAPPVAPLVPVQPVQEGIEEEENEGWGHWAMGNNVQEIEENEMEVELAPNAAFQGLLDAIQAEEMILDNPPLADSSSAITFSSGSSNSGDNATDQQIVVHAGEDLAIVPFNQMGEGLQNIVQAYLDEEGDDLEDGMLLQDNVVNLQENNNENALHLLENVNLVPPHEAHLMIGRVETHFFNIPEEHDLTKRFSKQGMKIWESYFAPHMLNSTASAYSHDIPVSWFNFVTLMLMTPDKFDWAKGFLSSQLWDIIKESVAYEHTISFVIPDKCVADQAPVCKMLEDMHESPNGSSLGADTTQLSPKRKRRDGKVPLVESEVRIEHLE
jgi:hypothetical protein